MSSHIRRRDLLTSIVMRMTIIHSNLKLCFSLRWLLIRSVSCVQCSSFSFTTLKSTENVWRSKNKNSNRSNINSFVTAFIYVDSAVDAEELAGLIVEFFQVFSVPVEIWCEEQVRPQVYTVSVRGGCTKGSILKQSQSS